MERGCVRDERTWEPSRPRAWSRPLCWQDGGQGTRPPQWWAAPRQGEKEPGAGEDAQRGGGQRQRCTWFQSEREPQKDQRGSEGRGSEGQGSEGQGATWRALAVKGPAPGSKVFSI